MSDSELEQLVWLEPWERLEPEHAANLSRQQQRELSEAHPLWGRAAVAIAKHAEVDDVLFALSDPEELVLVHLANKRASSTESPSFMRFESLAEFVEGCMRPDHLEYTDPDD